MKSLNDFITEAIIINERNMVTFDNNKLYPNNGWAVIILGGSGSGKGWFKNNKLPIDGKIIDVDNLKDKFSEMGLDKEILNGETYNSKNVKHVSAIHKAVHDRHWKDKILRNFFRTNILNGRLDNIIFDITGQSPENSVTNKIISLTYLLGYKVCCIWVIAKREEAMIRNIQRPRSVPDETLHNIHASLAKNLPEFLQKNNTAKYINDLWLYFSTPLDIKRPYNSKEEDRNALIKVNKIIDVNGSKFVFDDDIKNRLDKYLTTDDASHFISSEELKNKYGIITLDASLNKENIKINRDNLTYDSFRKKK